MAKYTAKKKGKLSKIIAIVLATGFSFFKLSRCSELSNKFSNDDITLLSASTQKGEVPIYDEDGNPIAEIENGTVMFYDGDFDKEKEYSEDDIIEVYTCTPNGMTVNGYVKVGNLKYISVIDRDKLEYYDSIYQINNDGSSVNFRTSPEMGRDNIKQQLDDGTRFLGSSKLVSKKDGSIWIPGIVIEENTEGEIQNIEGYVRSDCARRIDSNGIVSEGQDLFLTKQDIMEVNTDGSSLRLRTVDRDTSNSKNILKEIPNKSIVYIVGDREEKDGIVWVEVVYHDPSIGYIRGYVSEKYLKQAKMIEMQVKDGDNLDLRSKPNENSAVLARIQEGTILDIPEQNINRKVNNNGKDWVEVILSDGTKGFALFEQLEETEITENDKKESEREKIVEKIIKNTKFNKNGNVIGIDTSFASRDKLKKVLDDDKVFKGKIYRTSDGYYYSSELTSNIGFGGIEIGAMSLTSSNIFDRPNFLDCADEYEKRKIPYFFYFFSTAENKDEVKKEIKYIKKCLKAIKPEERKYDLLPFVYDREPGSSSVKNGKLYPGKDTSEITAYAITELRKILPYNVAFYSGANDFVNNTIFNLETVNSLLDKPVDVWCASHISKNGAINSSHKKIIEEKGSNNVITQIVIDAVLNGTHVDIDVIDGDTYKFLLLGKEGEELKKAVEAEKKEKKQKEKTGQTKSQSELHGNFKTQAQAKVQPNAQTIHKRGNPNRPYMLH